MPLNSYVTLGRSGLRVSPFCLGAMTFGEDFGVGASVKDSEAILAHYLEQGGNCIDTVKLYSAGHSEKIIGDFFQQGNGKRDRAVIATKFGFNFFAGDPNGGGSGRKAIVAQCEESLRRLQTDYIDLYTCKSGIGLRPSRKRWLRSTTWFNRARFATSVSPMLRHGRLHKRR